MTHDGRAAIVGAGPNGLAAAVTLARAGVPVTVFEAAETIGGGTRTTELVQPGVLHDVCSAIHPMALATEFFRRFELSRRVEFVVPEASYAQPLDSGGGPGGRAAIAYRDLARTAAELGRDGAAYRRLYAPVLRRLDGVLDFALGGSMTRLPRDPLAALVTALRTVEQGTPLWGVRFRDEAAPALLAGVAAHSIGALPSLAPAAVGIVLGALGHAGGWPVPVGGSRAITDALAADLLAHGGRIETNHPISRIGELDGFRTKLFDTSTRGLLGIAGDALPARYRRALARFSFGDAATKVDFVLDGPIPWRDPRVGAAPTVHLGGTRAEIAAAEREVARGRHPERPFVLLAQPTEFDPARNPAGVNAVWSYTHVPSGSDVDVAARVIAQIERFAPGFRDRIVAHSVTTAAALSQYNRNYVGGDFSAGAITMRQLLARPVVGAEPWRTPVPGVYLASSATPPGPGVHGLAGWYAARSALRHEYGLDVPELGLE
ncbi:phytoene desaturase family protein [Leucobacter luti]|uniref:Pyridine nucleotide-disulfide oxidoreductase domain-containing protein 2 n=1 Tax=Leucobacter luti TaxID=340320 RepID=A0A4Q7TSZ3_9MICO|nr:NAD(P)/FAD-dependent oxidoreductase [Leucobacter luti]MBL3700002.1 NAD(P)/FAD-dependent oxidoreductase [Leucobacter luti]RZT62682.1 phytoene dehydrogenase-like protein [Leucobacter luti]